MWISGKSAAVKHREDRHGLGAAVDRVSPLGSEEIEDGRDQRTGVADADPEHEGDDVDTPEDRRLVARRRRDLQ